MVRVMSHRRYSEKQRQAWVAKFERTGSSAAAFCRKHQLNYQAFLRWRREPADQSQLVPEFLEVEVPRPSAGGAPSETVEFIFPSGLVLRIQPQGSPRS